MDIRNERIDTFVNNEGFSAVNNLTYALGSNDDTEKNIPD